MQPLLNIAINAARTAGDFIVRHIEQLDRVNIQTKENQEYVSDVDLKAEALIIKTIQKAYPGHGIIAEESGIHQEDAENVWIIDPLDGTNNFLHGYPSYAISIAHQDVHKKIQHAVVYDPLRHECFIASRGRGARLNDRRMRVSKQTQLDMALIGSSVPTRNPALLKQYLPLFTEVAMQGPSIRHTGSVALNLAYVAAGRLDGCWHLGLRLWDSAAGMLLIQEAGGLISGIHGEPSTDFRHDIVTGTPKIFKALLQAFANTST